MSGKPTLYQLLDLPQEAPLAELRAAFRSKVNALEEQRSTLEREAFEDRMQLLRLAYSTLSDAVSRTGYDAELQAAAAATQAGPASSVRAHAAAPSLALAPDRDAHFSAASAEALRLRADALSLRADALLLRAGLEAGHPAGSTLAADVLFGVKRVVRAIGLLVAVGMLAYGITRCASGDSVQRRTAIESKAAEQTALQEYHQTYGVRPANMAELELMEAARRRKESEQRQTDQAKRSQEQELSRFERDSRHRGEEVSRDLRRQEEEQRRRAERERELQDQAEQLKLEADLATSEAERRRLELRRKQTLDRLKQP